MPDQPSPEALKAASVLERDDVKPWDEDFKIAVVRTLDAFAQQARDRALEEAAAIAEWHANCPADAVAIPEALRALKSKELQT